TGLLAAEQKPPSLGENEGELSSKHSLGEVSDEPGVPRRVEGTENWLRLLDSFIGLAEPLEFGRRDDANGDALIGPLVGKHRRSLHDEAQRLPVDAGND